MFTRALTAVAVAVLTAGLLSACSGASTPASSGPNAGYVSGDGSITVIAAPDRQAAPQIDAITLDGAKISLQHLRGRVVVMNVWASWCAPCRAEAPVLQRTWTSVKGTGVQFIGLDTRDSLTAASNFITNFGITYPNVLDTDGSIQLQFASTLPPEAIPSTVVIDGQGRVAARALGRVDQDTLTAMIDSARDTPLPKHT